MLCVQRYVELFRSTKGEMMTAVQQKMYGMYPAANSYSQYGAGGQVPTITHIMGGADWMTGYVPRSSCQTVI